MLSRFLLLKNFSNLPSRTKRNDSLFYNGNLYVKRFLITCFTGSAAYFIYRKASGNFPEHCVKTTIYRDVSIRDELIQRIKTNLTYFNNIQQYVVESMFFNRFLLLDGVDTINMDKLNNIAMIKIFQSDHQSTESKLFNMQTQFNKELEQLNSEVEELQRQILINRLQHERVKPMIKKSLIEMYSEVLDELSGYNNNYSAQDHLPRVVVVGEQSAGKTSVLEMVAQARLFPRGAGSMMTRSPIQVTLAEGPFSVARFEGENGPEFDLSTSQGQKALREEIERRMNKLAAKTTISKTPISLTVRGPNLHRMVLVDLPGVINTVTSGMHADAKDAVISLSKHYMSNPNAIILCIQDGSKDAETSSIVDLVSSMDPLGKRTIFVMTKVDLAESQMENPNRIRDILSGDVFQMKALGYFAVIAGKGNKEESIDDVRKYEEQYFKTSRLFRSGVMQQHQLTTESLSRAVSDKFWKMVEEAVEQQCDTFRAFRFNLETEWKHKFKGIRELDRTELFERGKNAIFDDLLTMMNIGAHQWQDKISHLLWNHIKNDVFETVFIPANQLTGHDGSYQTTVDIKFKNWVESSLPDETVKIGQKILLDEFNQIQNANSKKSEDPALYKPLKDDVNSKCLSSYQWDNKAKSALRVIQTEALNNTAMKSKSDWEMAAEFLKKSLEQQLEKTKRIKDDLMGPGFARSWLSWSSKTDVQKKRTSVIEELEHIIRVDTKHRMTLASDEITSVRRNLQLKKVDVDADFIKETWNVIYRFHFYEKSLQKAKECQNKYHYYQKNPTECEIDCRDLTVFWRLLKMLDSSASALRMQIVNNENRRLERSIKEILYNIQMDDDKLKQLIYGDRVKLAEDLKQIRRIQEKLEEFIHALKSKSH